MFICIKEQNSNILETTCIEWRLIRANLGTKSYRDCERETRRWHPKEYDMFLANFYQLVDKCVSFKNLRLLSLINCNIVLLLLYNV